MSEHECNPPPVSTWPLRYQDEDWTCGVCGQWWHIVPLNHCRSCHRSDGPGWEKFGTGDGTFPGFSVPRGGMEWGAPRE